MIQEIAPQKLYNEFRVNQEIAALDFIIFVKENQVLVSEGEELFFPRRRELHTEERGIYLFSIDGQAFFLLSEDFCPHEKGWTWKNLREIRGLAPQAHIYAAYTAYHLADWYRANQFCGKCGGTMKHSEKERAQVCSSCSHTVYPRIFPAVIVGVTHGDEILMTKYANRNMPFYALIAGFIEIGETAEEAVAREVMEEAGLRVKNIRYYKSQPWGVVSDILLGFYCDVDGDPTIRLDRQELKEGVWMKREDIVGQPDGLSLTHHMMMTFKEGKEPK